MRLYRTVAIVAALTLMGPLAATSPDAAGPQTAPCIFDMRAEHHRLSATALSGCLFVRLTAECHGSAQGLFYVDRSGVLAPPEVTTPHVSLSVDPDGIHTTVSCKAPACVVSFSAGQGKREEHRLDPGQSVIGPLEARVSISFTTKP